MKNLNEIDLPTRGLTTPVLLGLAAAVVLVVVGSALLYLVQTLHGKPLPLTSLSIPIGLIVAFTIVTPLFSLSRRPSHARLSAEGLEINYPFRRVRVPWHDLMRVRAVTQGVVVFRSISDQVNRFGGAYWITLEQARAILADPRCPTVNLRDDQRRLIFENSAVSWSTSPGR